LRACCATRCGSAEWVEEVASNEMIKVAGREAVTACENGKVHVMLFIYSKGRAVLEVSLMNRGFLEVLCAAVNKFLMGMKAFT
jgi:hypothetical protein